MLSRTSTSCPVLIRRVNVGRVTFASSENDPPLNGWWWLWLLLVVGTSVCERTCRLRLYDTLDDLLDEREGNPDPDSIGDVEVVAIEELDAKGL